MIKLLFALAGLIVMVSSITMTLLFTGFAVYVIRKLSRED